MQIAVKHSFAFFFHTQYNTYVMVHKILTGLNRQQQKAVTALDGPVLVLAGAGSGKTKTLVHRIAYLIYEKKATAHNILAVTFTNKAAGEMQTRVEKLLREDDPRALQAGRPTIGTFHAVSVRILRSHAPALGYKSSFTIYDDMDAKKLIKQIMLEQDLSPKKYAPTVFYGLIQRAKNDLVTPESFSRRASSFIEEVVGKVYEEYQQRLQEANAFDFGDLIMKVVELFEAHPDILAVYHSRWLYILVDEYQDTNHAQYRWIKLLSAKNKNVYVVGDDAQSIYLFRGADVRNILDFECDYPNATVILLEQNYRSTQRILDVGNAIIKDNKSKIEKHLWTENPQGESVEVIEVFDEREEGRQIIVKIAENAGITASLPKVDHTNDDEVAYVSEDEAYEQEQRSDGGGGVLDRILAMRGNAGASLLTSALPVDFSSLPLASKAALNDYVVLYRTNAQSRSLEEIFLLAAVPYRIVGGIRFYERKEVKDAMAYLKMIASPEDWISAQRIINTPSRGIGDKTFARLWAAAREHKWNVDAACAHVADVDGIGARGQNAVGLFHAMLGTMRTKAQDMRPSELFTHVVEASGLRDALLDGTDEGEARWENVQELKSVAAKFDTAVGEQALQSFLEEVALFSDLDTLETAGNNAITLMTMHMAKGLEFPVVFIAGLEEGLFPHSQSMMDPAQLEEERRLFYVGITRAKRKLYLLHAAQRSMFGSTSVNMPSRFLSSLPKDGVKWIG